MTQADLNAALGITPQRLRYEALIRDALPYARAEIAALKARGDHLSNEPQWLRTICADYAVAAMIRGDTSERYIGGRVKDLRAIYAAAEPEPYGSDNPAWVRWALLSPETAIREAVEAGETHGRKAA